MSEETIGSRLSHAWNAFMGRDPTLKTQTNNIGVGYYTRPDRIRYYGNTDRNVVTSIYNRISLDVAGTNIEHVKLDNDRNYIKTIDSGLNACLNIEANIDQTSQDFIQDIVLSMFDEGVVAVVPTETSINPEISGSYNIDSMRTGKIVEWFPKHVKINCYDERDGIRKDIIMPKETVAIIQNPFYSVMNEPNSTLKRLIRVMNQIDRTNEDNASGKLDIIIQLPYSVKSPSRRDQAEERRKMIETQLKGSKYGIAYADATERITQLNRPVENNLWTQYTDLSKMLYNQLGLTEEIFNGTANEQVMINYYTTTIKPILVAISKEFSRKFLTKTARSQKQTIWFFRDPFELVPVDKIAEISDKFTRNEILSSNEVRGVIGRKPSSDPRADELRNSNMPDKDQGSYRLPKTGDSGDVDYLRSQIKKAVERNKKLKEENQNEQKTRL